MGRARRGPGSMAPDSTRSASRARLPFQSIHITGTAATALNPPPSHHGSRSRSDQVKRVRLRRRPLARSLKVPVPLTTPV